MKQKSQAWFTVFLLFLVYGINYLDRVALSIVAPIVQTDLGIDATQMGLVFSTFFVGYALFNFIGGLASDRLGPKLVYVLSVGLYSAIPYGSGVIGIVAIARRSDRLMERRRHFAACAIGAGIALAALTLHLPSLPLMLAILSVAVVCVYAAMPVFWAIPPAYLSGAAAAGGIAFISSVGQIGGFASPYAIGLIRSHFGRLDHGWHLTSALLCAGGVVMYATLRPRR